MNEIGSGVGFRGGTISSLVRETYLLIESPLGGDTLTNNKRNSEITTVHQTILKRNDLPATRMEFCIKADRCVRCLSSSFVRQEFVAPSIK